MSKENKYIEVSETLKTIVINILNSNINRSEVSGDSNLLDLGIDSMSIVDLVMAIEDEFDLIIKDEDLSEELFERFQKLIDYVFKNGTIKN